MLVFTGMTTECLACATNGTVLKSMSSTVFQDLSTHRD